MPNDQDQNLISIQQASKILGVSEKTLRRWEERGVLVPSRTIGGHRRYILNRVTNFKKAKGRGRVTERKLMEIKPEQARDVVLPRFEDQKSDASILINPTFDTNTTIGQPNKELIYNRPPLTVSQKRFLLGAFIGLFVFAAVYFSASHPLKTSFNFKLLSVDSEKVSTAVTSLKENLSASGNKNTIKNVLAASSFENISFNVNVDSFFKENAVFNQNATVDGTAAVATLAIGGDSFTDLTGSGLQVAGEALQTTLGTSVETGEITDGTILEVDLNSSNTASSGQILSYDSTTGGFKWASDATGSGEDSPWQTTSNVVRLDTSTDNVTVGSSTNLGKIGVDGDADEIQLLIQGNSTQTSNLVVFENSSGTDLFALSGTGGLTLSGFDCTGNTNGGTLTADASGVISCTDDDGGGSSTTLQGAYDNDTNGSDAIIALTSGDDSIILRNPAASGSDSAYILSLDQLATGAVDGLVISNAGTGTLITADASGTGTMADGILIRQTSSGTITDAIDITDETITNALNVDANFIEFDGIRLFEGATATLTFEDTSGNDLVRIVDTGTVGYITSTNGTSSDDFGLGATTGAEDESLAVGYGATVSNDRAVAIGTNALASGHRGVALGTDSIASGLEAIALGKAAEATAANAIALGYAAIADTANALIIGSNVTTDDYIDTIYFGHGRVYTAPTSYIFTVTGGSGTDIGGGGLYIAGGRGTGTGAGGDIIFQTAPAGSTSSSLNALVDRMTIADTGDIDITFPADANLTIDADTTNTTTTTGVADLNVGTDVNGAIGFNLDFDFDDDSDSSDTVYGASININNDSGDAADVIYGLRLQEIAQGTATGDKITDALLLLDNADTATGDDVTITDAIRITNSGDIAAGIVNGLNIDDTDITTDLVLQNDETISNDSNGTIAFGATTLSGVGTTTIVSDQATVALLNATTTTINAFSAATAVNLADAAITGTIDIGGVTADGATTVNIATNSSTADTIAIGNSATATTLALTGGDDWSITSGGVHTIIPAATGTFLDFDLETEWTTGDLVNADWDSGTTQTGALTGLNLDFTNLTSVAGSTTYGLVINDLAAQTTSTEYAIYQEGTNWDRGALFADAVQLGENGADGQLILFNEIGVTDYTVTFNLSDSQGADIAYTLPADDGAADNYVLTTNGSGILNWEAVGGVGGVTTSPGDGTSGQIAFFTGTTTITSETSGFGWDSTNNVLTITATGSTATDGVLNLDYSSAANGFEGINASLNVTDDAGVDTLMGSYLTVDNDATSANDNVYALYIENSASSTGDLDAALYIDNADAAQLIANGIQFAGSGGGAYTTGINFSSGTFTTGIDLSGGTLTTDITLDDGLTISQTSDADLDIVEGGLTLNLDFAETTASTITATTASNLEFESTANTSNALVLESTIGGIDITATGAGAGEDIDLAASSSINLSSSEAVSDAIKFTASDAAGQIFIDAGTTDKTADAVRLDVDVNSASIDSIYVDLDVGTALSAAETVSGAHFDVAGNAGDDSGSFVYGLLLTGDVASPGTVSGINFAGSFDTGIDLSGTATTTDIILDDGLTIAQTSDADLDIVEGGLTLNMDFAETTASTITTSTVSALDYTVSGDEGFTFTSSETTGTTTTSAFVFDATAITSGTGWYLTADSVAGGNLGQISTTGNTFTTGDLLEISTTATSITSGNLLNVSGTSVTTGFTGNIANIEWAPSSSATSTTGDVLQVTIGTNGTLSTGYIFNVVDTSTSVFSVSESAITSALPHSFTAEGDVTVAYDLVFSNQTASYLKSSAPLYIQAGESFESNNLNLQVYNSGSVLIDGSTDVNTGTGGVLDINVNSTTANNVGLREDYTVDTGATAADDLFAGQINLQQNDADADLYGLYMNLNATSVTIAGTNLLECFLCLENDEAQAASVANAIWITSTAATAGSITNGINLDTTDITTDIILQNDEVIQNNVDGTIVLDDSGGTDLLTISTTAFTINLDDTATYTEVLCHNGADGATGVQSVGDCNVSGGGADLAEYFGSDGSLVPGDVVEIDDAKPVVEFTHPRLGFMSKVFVKKATGNNSKAIGIVSTNPFSFVLSEGAFSESEYPVAVALSGRVPVTIAEDSESISAGDYLTASQTTPGKATKATASGPVIAKALEAWIPGSGEQSTIAFVDNTWYYPDIALNQDGNVSASADFQNTGYFRLQANSGNIVEKLSGITNLIAANIQAGFAEVTTLVADSITSREVRTSEIAPLDGNGDIALRVGDPSGSGTSGFGKLLIQNREGETIASVDEEGNIYTEGNIEAGSATFSGEITAESVTTETTTVSGELSANTIQANEVIAANLMTRDEIEALLREAESNQELVNQIVNESVNQTATSSAQPNELVLENLYVTGTAAVNSLSLSQSLVIGSDLVISSPTSNIQHLTSIDTLTAPLSIQSSASQPLSIMAGLVTIDTSGNVQITGNLDVAGNISGSSLNLHPTSNISQPESGFGKLLSLYDSQGSEVASITATGSAIFKTLETAKLIIPDDPTATSSATFAGLVYETKASAGSAKVPSGSRDVTIKNSNITSDSLVFVTPTSQTSNTIYVKEQTQGEIKVGFDEPQLAEVNFNWWVVQLEKQANAQ